MKLFKQLGLVGLFAASCSANAISLIGPSITYNGHIYTEITTDTWTNSEAFAVSQGAHLVAVNDAAENAFLISTFGSNHALWLGFHRTGPNPFDFVWTNGDAVTYTNWAAFEPNNCCAGEDYTHTYLTGDWNDLSDDNTYAGDKYGIMEVATVNTPEPSILLMALTGLGLLGFVRRRAAK
jgi:MYXO-CTERM domain-containing protein